MCKKILVILGMVLFVSLNITNLYAETIQIVPLQKPSLSSEEIIKKINGSLNFKNKINGHIIFKNNEINFKNFKKFFNWFEFSCLII